MDMDIMEIIDLMEEAIEKASAVPLTGKVMIDKDEILDYIESHIDQLNNSLTKLGYNVSTAVELNTTPYTFNTHVMEQEIPPVEIKRFSFDVRA